MSFFANTPKPEGRRVLITGGGGFIGTALAEQLVDHNEVVLMDLGFDQSPASLGGLLDHDNISTLTGNVLEPADVKRATDGCDVIVHLAAIVGVSNVLSRGRQTIETNFTGTSNLLKALEGRDDLHRVVYFSTSEVFGMNSFRADEETPASVGPVTEARWTYSIAKLAGEHLVHCYHRELNMPTVIVRPFNVFGPPRTGDHAMLRFIVNALRNDPIEVHGDGTQIRSWCYIDDFIDGLLRTMTLPEAIGEGFNLGNPRNTVTIYELAKRVVQLLESSSKIDYAAIDFSDIDVRVPRLRKSEQLLGYNPRVELDEAILKTAAWCREHMHVLAPDALAAQTG